MTAHRFGHEVGRRCGDERERAAHLVGCRCHEVAPEPRNITRHRRRPREEPTQHDRADGVQLQGERGDDAEVAATAPQPPEQLRVLVRRRVDHPPVGGHDLGPDQVVAREGELPLQPAAAAPEGEAGDAGVGHPATGDREPVLLGGGVELAPVEPGLGAHRARRRVDLDALHAAHVDDQSLVDHRGAGHPVPAPVHRDGQSLLAREVHHRDHVVGGAAHGDHRRAVVDHGVEDGARLVVSAVVRGEDVSPEARNAQTGRARRHVVCPLSTSCDRPPPLLADPCPDHNEVRRKSRSRRP